MQGGGEFAAGELGLRMLKGEFQRSLLETVRQPGALQEDGEAATFLPFFGDAMPHERKLQLIEGD